MTERPDNELLHAVHQGDRLALGVLFDRYHRDVFAYCARLLTNTGPEVDDVVQNTFIQVARASGRFKGRSSVKTWILGIATNVARGTRRSQGRRTNAAVKMARLPEERVIQPDELAGCRQLLQRVSQALAGLSHEQRSAYTLCVIEGLSAREAARALGVREGTIWRRVHTARKALLKILHEEPGLEIQR